MALPSRTRRTIVFGGGALLIILSVATLAFTASADGPECTHAQGRLFNVPGRMIGTISGDYKITGPLDQGTEAGDGSGIMFLWTTSQVDSKQGTIFFREYSALDFSEEEGPNGAVLLVADGGTGKWQDARGHITLSGFFHLGEMVGEWTYTGEVCVP